MQIKEPLNNLIESIKESDIYLTYKHILSQVEENVEINGLVNDIKRLQQRLVKEENKNSSKVNNLEKELEKKKEELNNIPLYQQYIDASNLLNDLIKTVNLKMQTYINDLGI